MVRVAVVDDHAVVREGIRAMLGREGDMQVVGEASEARAALQMVEETSPDVVLLDVSLPGTSGISATRELLRRNPERRVLLFSMYSTEDFVAEGLSAGAAGYVSKEQEPRELVDAIRLVARGQSYLSPKVSGLVVSDFVRMRKGGSPENSPLERLSPREREVLDLMLRGLTNEGIAGQLFISRRTVETHRAHILKKLNVHSLPELFRLAARRGLIRD